MKIKSDIVVVGSGAGGATIAKELAKGAKNVLVLERGPFVKKMGTQRAALGFYDKCALRTSRDGITTYRTLMVGGTTVVSCGNGIAILKKELENRGIDLSQEIQETLQELNIKPLSSNLIGEGSRLIMDIGNKFGLEFEPMPKFIDSKKCVSCGLCILGCKTGAKWSAIKFIKEMQKFGGKIITGVDVKSVVTHKRRAIGLTATYKGKKVKIYAKKIIISAGAISSPVILKRSGIDKAGNNLSVDLLSVTYGILRNREINLFREPTMAVGTTKFLENNGFLMSPFIDVPLIYNFIKPKNKPFKRYRSKNMLGIMTKIRDDNSGKIISENLFYKNTTEKDLKKLKQGDDLARQILLEAGVKKCDIFTAKPRGAHPGGSAAIGEVVDNNLMTELENLYVCDASVLPISSGVPPIITIIALAKRLAKQIVTEDFKQGLCF